MPSLRVTAPLAQQQLRRGLVHVRGDAVTVRSVPHRRHRSDRWLNVTDTHDGATFDLTLWCWMVSHRWNPCSHSHAAWGADTSGPYGKISCSHNHPATPRSPSHATVALPHRSGHEPYRSGGASIRLTTVRQGGEHHECGWRDEREAPNADRRGEAPDASGG